MQFDHVLRNARLVGEKDLRDIGWRQGRIIAIEPKLVCDVPQTDAGGRLVVAGFVDTHVHLDKSCILGRCNCREGTLAEAIAETAAAKRGFTEADVYERAQRTLEKAILQGTTRMRTHVEVDPRIGLTSFNAIKRLKADYAFAIDLQICVFPQEGLLNDPGCEELLIEACEQGADLIGGCPYTDSDPNGHIARIFDIAKRFDLDIDFHLDFDLDPSAMSLPEVCRQAVARGWQGRVAIGHVTKLSALSQAKLDEFGRLLAQSGVALTVLPATDLFLMGRGHEHSVPRGVTPVHRLTEQGVNASLATNNVLNPFTPFGDCSLVRMANLYANIAQIGRTADMELCLSLVTNRPASLMRLPDYGIATGNAADIVVLNCMDAASAIAELAPPLLVFKRGAMTVSRPAAMLIRPQVEKQNAKSEAA
ncbi:amidohydrolase family protein [Pseudorhodoplanes sp.]|uniref:amidohydrolase family protein n=1 Tax=Pseudorhodoplanes sp. TaxID=1934341 RepID=UPI002C89345C|nr:amidohydrolase family protein [Pseudorhodoplanes sp.]HWV54202.1 amidohydrolase family protein [Pseudorhodoplanes sp.]